MRVIVCIVCVGGEFEASNGFTAGCHRARIEPGADRTEVYSPTLWRQTSKCLRLREDCWRIGSIGTLQTSKHAMSMVCGNRRVLKSSGCGK